jgi:hypothetical protein
MRLILALALAGSLPLVAPARKQPSSTPGSSLKLGMQLVYNSQGREGAPWRVDSLDLNARFGNRTPCSVVRFGARDLRRTCVDGDTLFAWNEIRQALLPTRPVGAGMSMRVLGANGQTLLYETSTADTVTLSDIRVPVMRTTIITVDSTGKRIRRLRERYALGLATAIDGIFEVPADSGGWRVEREFSLVRIVPPAP